MAEMVAKAKHGKGGGSRFRQRQRGGSRFRRWKVAVGKGKRLFSILTGESILHNKTTERPSCIQTSVEGLISNNCMGITAAPLFCANVSWLSD